MAGAKLDVGSLEDAAIKRRERLKNLKRKKQGTSDGKSGGNIEEDKELDSLPKPQFRSYKPANEELNNFILEPAAPGDITSEVKNHLESAKTDLVIDQLDVTSLAPRKPDWDLKRDVAPKLAILERQTQRAIAELIWERLKERKNEDLASIVNVGTTDNT